MTSWPILGAVVLLSGWLLWMLVAPRSHWRVLFGWSARDPDASEPGDGVHGLRRALAGIGLLGVLVVGGLQVAAIVVDRPLDAPEPDGLQLMWGTPTPHLVDRVIDPIGQAPEGYVAGELRGYQEIDRGLPPNYLAELPRFAFLGQSAPAGLVGRAPITGYTGYGAGDILLEVTGPLACIPRFVVAEESELIVSVEVWWGLPGAADQDHAGGCDTTAPLTQTVLLPVQLSGDLGDRLVVTPDGVPVPEVVDTLG